MHCHLIYRAPNRIQNQKPSVHTLQDCRFRTLSSPTRTAMFEGSKRNPFLVDWVLSGLTVIYVYIYINTQIHYDARNANNVLVIKQYTHFTSIPCWTPLCRGKPEFFHSDDWNPEHTDPQQCVHKMRSANHARWGQWSNQQQTSVWSAKEE